MVLDNNNLIGNSPAFDSLLRCTRLIAATDVTVLIHGESGTGKECLAQLIHQTSRRADHPFVCINCAALPESLMESELFGHRKGAFTGANQDAIGRIASAEGGTVFLDEIGELPLSSQATFLRFLESGEIQPVGEAQPRKINVRVIAATNRNLANMVESGEFRTDLYYRLYVVPLEMPPLRDRDGDVKRLLERFFKEFADKHQLDKPRLHRSALKALNKHTWPGNVRELRNLCERLTILFSGREVLESNLPQEIRGELSATNNQSFALPAQGVTLHELEIDMIRQALSKAKGNRSRAARLLGLTRDTFLYRLRKYAIE